MKRARLAAALALALLAAPTARAGASRDALLSARTPEAPPAPRTRDFATPDLARAQRLAIAALQDLGFALESADAERSAITASRLDAHPLRLTVTLSAPTESTVTAAVSADYAGTPVSDPRPAEAFFAALARQLSPPPAID